MESGHRKRHDKKIPAFRNSKLRLQIGPMSTIVEESPIAKNSTVSSLLESIATPSDVSATSSSDPSATSHDVESLTTFCSSRKSRSFHFTTNSRMDPSIAQLDANSGSRYHRKKFRRKVVASVYSKRSLSNSDIYNQTYTVYPVHVDVPKFVNSRVSKHKLRGKNSTTLLCNKESPMRVRRPSILRSLIGELLVERDLEKKDHQFKCESNVSKESPNEIKVVEVKEAKILEDNAMRKQKHKKHHKSKECQVEKKRSHHKKEKIIEGKKTDSPKLAEHRGHQKQKKHAKPPKHENKQTQNEELALGVDMKSKKHKRESSLVRIKQSLMQLASFGHRKRSNKSPSSSPEKVEVTIKRSSHMQKILDLDSASLDNLCSCCENLANDKKPRPTITRQQLGSLEIPPYKLKSKNRASRRRHRQLIDKTAETEERNLSKWSANGTFGDSITPMDNLDKIEFDARNNSHETCNLIDPVVSSFDCSNFMKITDVDQAGKINQLYCTPLGENEKIQNLMESLYRKPIIDRCPHFMAKPYCYMTINQNVNSHKIKHRSTNTDIIWTRDELKMEKSGPISKAKTKIPQYAHKKVIPRVSKSNMTIKRRKAMLESDSTGDESFKLLRSRIPISSRSPSGNRSRNNSVSSEVSNPESIKVLAELKSKIPRLKTEAKVTEELTIEEEFKFPETDLQIMSSFTKENNFINLDEEVLELQQSDIDEKCTEKKVSEVNFDEILEKSPLVELHKTHKTQKEFDEDSTTSKNMVATNSSVTTKSTSKMFQKIKKIRNEKLPNNNMSPLKSNDRNEKLKSNINNLKSFKSPNRRPWDHTTIKYKDFKSNALKMPDGENNVTKDCKDSDLKECKKDDRVLKFEDNATLSGISELSKTPKSIRKADHSIVELKPYVELKPSVSKIESDLKNELQTTFIVNLSELEGRHQSRLSSPKTKVPENRISTLNENLNDKFALYKDILKKPSTSSVSLQVLVDTKHVDTNTSFSSVISRSPRRPFTKSRLPLPVYDRGRAYKEPNSYTFPIEIDLGNVERDADNVSLRNWSPQTSDNSSSTGQNISWSSTEISSDSLLDNDTLWQKIFGYCCRGLEKMQIQKVKIVLQVTEYISVFSMDCDQYSSIKSSKSFGDFFCTNIIANVAETQWELTSGKTDFVPSQSEDNNTDSSTKIAKNKRRKRKIWRNCYQCCPRLKCIPNHKQIGNSKRSDKLRTGNNKLYSILSDNTSLTDIKIRPSDHFSNENQKMKKVKKDTTNESNALSAVEKNENNWDIIAKEKKSNEAQEIPLEVSQKLLKKDTIESNTISDVENVENNVNDLDTNAKKSKIIEAQDIILEEERNFFLKDTTNESNTLSAVEKNQNDLDTNAKNSKSIEAQKNPLALITEEENVTAEELKIENAEKEKDPNIGNIRKKSKGKLKIGKTYTRCFKNPISKKRKLKANDRKASGETDKSNDIYAPTTIGPFGMTWYHFCSKLRQIEAGEECLKVLAPCIKGQMQKAPAVDPDIPPEPALQVVPSQECVAEKKTMVNDSFFPEIEDQRTVSQQEEFWKMTPAQRRFEKMKDGDKFHYEVYPNMGDLMDAMEEEEEVEPSAKKHGVGFEEPVESSQLEEPWELAESEPRETIEEIPSKPIEAEETKKECGCSTSVSCISCAAPEEFHFTLTMEPSFQYLQIEFQDKKFRLVLTRSLCKCSPCDLDSGDCERTNQRFFKALYDILQMDMEFAKKLRKVLIYPIEELLGPNQFAVIAQKFILDVLSAVVNYQDGIFYLDAEKIMKFELKYRSLCIDLQKRVNLKKSSLKRIFHLYKHLGFFNKSKNCLVATSNCCKCNKRVGSFSVRSKWDRGDCHKHAIDNICKCKYQDKLISIMASLDNVKNQIDQSKMLQAHYSFKNFIPKPASFYYYALEEHYVRNPPVLWVLAKKLVGKNNAECKNRNCPRGIPSRSICPASNERIGSVRRSVSMGISESSLDHKRSKKGDHGRKKKDSSKIETEDINTNFPDENSLKNVQNLFSRIKKKSSVSAGPSSGSSYENIDTTDIDASPNCTCENVGVQSEEQRKVSKACHCEVGKCNIIGDGTCKKDMPKLYGKKKSYGKEKKEKSRSKSLTVNEGTAIEPVKSPSSSKLQIKRKSKNENQKEASTEITSNNLTVSTSTTGNNEEKEKRDTKEKTISKESDASSVKLASLTPQSVLRVTSVKYVSTSFVDDEQQTQLSFRPANDLKNSWFKQKFGVFKHNSPKIKTQFIFDPMPHLIPGETQTNVMLSPNWDGPNSHFSGCVKNKIKCKCVPKNPPPITEEILPPPGKTTPSVTIINCPKASVPIPAEAEEEPKIRKCCPCIDSSSPPTHPKATKFQKLSEESIAEKSSHSIQLPCPSLRRTSKVSAAKVLPPVQEYPSKELVLYAVKPDLKELREMIEALTNGKIVLQNDGNTKNTTNEQLRSSLETLLKGLELNECCRMQEARMVLNSTAVNTCPSVGTLMTPTVSMSQTTSFVAPTLFGNCLLHPPQLVNVAIQKSPRESWATKGTSQLSIQTRDAATAGILHIGTTTKNSVHTSVVFESSTSKSVVVGMDNIKKSEGTKTSRIDGPIKKNCSKVGKLFENNRASENTVHNEEFVCMDNLTTADKKSKMNQLENVRDSLVTNPPRSQYSSKIKELDVAKPNNKNNLPISVAMKIDRSTQYVSMETYSDKSTAFTLEITQAPKHCKCKIKELDVEKPHDKTSLPKSLALKIDRSTQYVNMETFPDKSNLFTYEINRAPSQLNYDDTDLGGNVPHDSKTSSNSLQKTEKSSQYVNLETISNKSNTTHSSDATHKSGVDYSVTSEATTSVRRGWSIPEDSQGTMAKVSSKSFPTDTVASGSSKRLLEDGEESVSKRIKSESQESFVMVPQSSMKSNLSTGFGPEQKSRRSVFENDEGKKLTAALNEMKKPNTCCKFPEMPIVEVKEKEKRRSSSTAKSFDLNKPECCQLFKKPPSVEEEEAPINCCKMPNAQTNENENEFYSTLKTEKEIDGSNEPSAMSFKKKSASETQNVTINESQLSEMKERSPRESENYHREKLISRENTGFLFSECCDEKTKAEFFGMDMKKFKANHPECCWPRELKPLVGETKPMKTKEDNNKKRCGFCRRAPPKRVGLKFPVCCNQQTREEFFIIGEKAFHKKYPKCCWPEVMESDRVVEQYIFGEHCGENVRRDFFNLGMKKFQKKYPQRYWPIVMPLIEDSSTTIALKEKSGEPSGQCCVPQAPKTDRKSVLLNEPERKSDLDKYVFNKCCDDSVKQAFKELGMKKFKWMYPECCWPRIPKMKITEEYIFEDCCDEATIKEFYDLGPKKFMKTHPQCCWPTVKKIEVEELPEIPIPEPGIKCCIPLPNEGRVSSEIRKSLRPGSVEYRFGDCCDDATKAEFFRKGMKKFKETHPECCHPTLHQKDVADHSENSKEFADVHENSSSNTSIVAMKQEEDTKEVSKTDFNISHLEKPKIKFKYIFNECCTDRAITAFHKMGIKEYKKEFPQECCWPKIEYDCCTDDPEYWEHFYQYSLVNPKLWSQLPECCLTYFKRFIENRNNNLPKSEITKVTEEPRTSQACSNDRHSLDEMFEIHHKHSSQAGEADNSAYEMIYEQNHTQFTSREDLTNDSITSKTSKKSYIRPKKSMVSEAINFEEIFSTSTQRDDSVEKHSSVKDENTSSGDSIIDKREESVIVEELPISQHISTPRDSLEVEESQMEKTPSSARQSSSLKEPSIGRRSSAKEECPIIKRYCLCKKPSSIPMGATVKEPSMVAIEEEPSISSHSSRSKERSQSRDPSKEEDSIKKNLSRSKESSNVIKPSVEEEYTIIKHSSRSKEHSKARKPSVDEKDSIKKNMSRSKESSNVIKPSVEEEYTIRKHSSKTKEPLKAREPSVEDEYSIKKNLSISKESSNVIKPSVEDEYSIKKNLSRSKEPSKSREPSVEEDNSIKKQSPRSKEPMKIEEPSEQEEYSIKKHSDKTKERSSARGPSEEEYSIKKNLSRSKESSNVIKPSMEEEYTIIKHSSKSKEPSKSREPSVEEENSIKPSEQEEYSIKKYSAKTKERSNARDPSEEEYSIKKNMSRSKESSNVIKPSVEEEYTIIKHSSKSKEPSKSREPLVEEENSIKPSEQEEYSIKKHSAKTKERSNARDPSEEEYSIKKNMSRSKESSNVIKPSVEEEYTIIKHSSKSKEPSKAKEPSVEEEYTIIKHSSRSKEPPKVEEPTVEEEYSIKKNLSRSKESSNVIKPSVEEDYSNKKQSYSSEEPPEVEEPSVEEEYSIKRPSSRSKESSKVIKPSVEEDYSNKKQSFRRSEEPPEVEEPSVEEEYSIKKPSSRSKESSKVIKPSVEEDHTIIKHSSKSKERSDARDSSVEEEDSIGKRTSKPKEHLTFKDPLLEEKYTIKKHSSRSKEYSKVIKPSVEEEYTIIKHSSKSKERSKAGDSWVEKEYSIKKRASKPKEHLMLKEPSLNDEDSIKIQSSGPINPSLDTLNSAASVEENLSNARHSSTKRKSSIVTIDRQHFKIPKESSKVRKSSTETKHSTTRGNSITKEPSTERPLAICDCTPKKTSRIVEPEMNKKSLISEPQSTAKFISLDEEDVIEKEKSNSKDSFIMKRLLLIKDSLAGKRVSNASSTNANELSEPTEKELSIISIKENRSIPKESSKQRELEMIEELPDEKKDSMLEDSIERVQEGSAIHREASKQRASSSKGSSLMATTLSPSPSKQKGSSLILPANKSMNSSIKVEKDIVEEPEFEELNFTEEPAERVPLDVEPSAAEASCRISLTTNADANSISLVGSVVPVEPEEDMKPSVSIGNRTSTELWDHKKPDYCICQPNVEAKQRKCLCSVAPPARSSGLNSKEGEPSDLITKNHSKKDFESKSDFHRISSQVSLLDRIDSTLGVDGQISPAKFDKSTQDVQNVHIKLKSFLSQSSLKGPIRIKIASKKPSSVSKEASSEFKPPKGHDSLTMAAETKSVINFDEPTYSGSETRVSKKVIAYDSLSDTSESIRGPQLRGDSAMEEKDNLKYLENIDFGRESFSTSVEPRAKSVDRKSVLSRKDSPRIKFSYSPDNIAEFSPKTPKKRTVRIVKDHINELMRCLSKKSDDRNSSEFSCGCSSVTKPCYCSKKKSVTCTCGRNLNVNYSFVDYTDLESSFLVNRNDNLHQTSYKNIFDFDRADSGSSIISEENNTDIVAEELKKSLEMLNVKTKNKQRKVANIVVELDDGCFTMEDFPRKCSKVKSSNQKLSTIAERTEEDGKLFDRSAKKDVNEIIKLYTRIRPESLRSSYGGSKSRFASETNFYFTDSKNTLTSIPKESSNGLLKRMKRKFNKIKLKFLRKSSQNPYLDRAKCRKIQGMSGAKINNFAEILHGRTRHEINIGAKNFLIKRPRGKAEIKNSQRTINSDIPSLKSYESPNDATFKHYLEVVNAQPTSSNLEAFKEYFKQNQLEQLKKMQKDISWINRQIAEKYKENAIQILKNASRDVKQEIAQTLLDPKVPQLKNVKIRSESGKPLNVQNCNQCISVQSTLEDAEDLVKFRQTLKREKYLQKYEDVCALFLDHDCSSCPASDKFPTKEGSTRCSEVNYLEAQEVGSINDSHLEDAEVFESFAPEEDQFYSIEVPPSLAAINTESICYTSEVPQVDSVLWTVPSTSKRSSSRSNFQRNMKNSSTEVSQVLMPCPEDYIIGDPQWILSTPSASKTYHSRSGSVLEKSNSRNRHRQNKAAVNLECLSNPSNTKRKQSESECVLKVHNYEQPEKMTTSKERKVIMCTRHRSEQQPRLLSSKTHQRNLNKEGRGRFSMESTNVADILPDTKLKRRRRREGRFDVMSYSGYDLRMPRDDHSTTATEDPVYEIFKKDGFPKKF